MYFINKRTLRRIIRLRARMSRVELSAEAMCFTLSLATGLLNLETSFVRPVFGVGFQHGFPPRRIPEKKKALQIESLL